jgi:hypothetical protein
MQIALRRTQQLTRVTVSLVLLAIPGCQRGDSEMPDPVDGSTTCAACGALIDDPHFAAQYRLADGTVTSFDDPACLFDALRGESTSPTTLRFRAHHDSGWLAAQGAWFARSPSTAAHGSGWAAYPSFAAAQDAVASGGSGEILSFDQAKSTLRRAP